MWETALCRDLHTSYRGTRPLPTAQPDRILLRHKDDRYANATGNRLTVLLGRLPTRLANAGKSGLDKSLMRRLDCLGSFYRPIRKEYEFDHHSSLLP